MEILLLGIYCFFVWLIFIKFKLLPWTTPFKVAVAIIPVVALATMGKIATATFHGVFHGSSLNLMKISQTKNA